MALWHRIVVEWYLRQKHIDGTDFARFVLSCKHHEPFGKRLHHTIMYSLALRITFCGDYWGDQIIWFPFTENVETIASQLRLFGMRWMKFASLEKVLLYESISPDIVPPLFESLKCIETTIEDFHMPQTHVQEYNLCDIDTVREWYLKAVDWIPTNEFAAKFITYIQLRWLPTEFEGYNDIIHALKNNDKVKSFSYACEDTSQEAVEAFGTFLQSNTTLKSFTFDCIHGFEYVGGVEFSKALQHNSSLTSYTLRHAYIDSDGEDELSKLLSNNTTLKILSLSENYVHYGFVNVMKAIANNNALEYVNLSCVNVEDPTMPVSGYMNGIATMLETNTCLKTLVADQKWMSDESATMLARALRRNTTLSCLDVNTHGVGTGAMVALLESIRESRSLKCVALGENALRKKGIDAFIHVIQRNATLEEIGIYDTSFNVQQAKRLLKALKENKVLQYLVIGGNRVYDELSRRFGDVVDDRLTIVESTEAYDSEDDTEDETNIEIPLDVPYVLHFYDE